MRALTSTQLAQLTGRLDEEAARVHTPVGLGKTALAALERPDPGDQTDVADREIAEQHDDAILAHYRKQLVDIAAARTRMAQGTYGICSDCDEPVTFARLNAYPTAKRCAECQRVHDRLHTTSM